MGRTCAGFLNFNICIVVGHSMIKTGRVITTLTGICRIYLPAPATFIYQHLPHLSTTTCHIYFPAPATFIYHTCHIYLPPLAIFIYHHLSHLSTSTCHIYLPAHVIFIYQHLSHLSTTTCHIYLPAPATFINVTIVWYLLCFCQILELLR